MKRALACHLLLFLIVGCIYVPMQDPKESLRQAARSYESERIHRHGPFTYKHGQTLWIELPREVDSIVAMGTNALPYLVYSSDDALCTRELKGLTRKVIQLKLKQQGPLRWPSSGNMFYQYVSPPPPTLN